ncbi:hypothetical protein Ahy_B07g088443 [Arachis hypogaea]|uniref:Uncharacterized protein n=1 Tax=Arachis hypogaea TaxID=3818 RepID=A0A444YEI1_ARAHY|nr:hypothetical protein Ahy_B07g088443 [Arachis hypogaea]
MGVGQGRPVSTVGGGSSRQQGWSEEGEEWAREQRNMDRESEEKQNSEESRIRDERAQQQKIREESVWKNQTGRKEEIAEPEEQVEKVPKIPNFQGVRDTEPDLGAAYKLKNLIKEIRERKNEWANRNKAQKGKQIIEIHGSRGMGPTKEIGAKEGVKPIQARMGMGSGLKHYTIEEGEVNSYRIAQGTLGLKKEGGKETIGQELKRLMLAKNKDIQVQDGRVEGKKIQALSKYEMEGDILKMPIEEIQKEDNEVGMYQNVILKAAPAISSDHYALILETQPRGRIKKEFKFEAFWADHEECKEVIRNSWQQDEGNMNLAGVNS